MRQHGLLYIKQGLKAHLRTSNPIIIIEGQYLQTFLHTLDLYDRHHCKTPLEVRKEALASDMPIGHPIPKNKRLNKYKEKWCA